jgi:hypothetical protein
MRGERERERERQTDMMELIVVFRNTENTSENDSMAYLCTNEMWLYFIVKRLDNIIPVEKGYIFRVHVVKAYGKVNVQFRFSVA